MPCSQSTFDMPAKQSKYWCFTSFVDNDGFLWYLPEEFVYLVQQEELCPTTGKVHWQGFVVCERKKAFGFFKKLLPKAHFEPMRGTVDEAADYCCDPRKRVDGGLLLEDGVRPLYGDAARSESTKERYKRCYDLAVAGDFHKIEPMMMVRHIGNIVKINTMMGKRPSNLNVATPPGVWLVGGAGSGKTTLANQFEHYAKDPANVWFDSYAKEKVVVVDDFEPYHIAQTNVLKQLGHQFAFLAQVKGASTWIRPHCAIVTSQYMIHTIWEKDAESRDAISRRYKSFTIPHEKEEAEAYIRARLADASVQSGDGVQAESVQASTNQEASSVQAPSGSQASDETDA